MTPAPTEKPSAISARKRAAAWRRKLLADGGCRIDLLLGREATEALERLERSTGDTATAVITGLLLKAKPRRR